MDQRTLTQNAALHKLFGLISEELNAAGLDVRTTLKPDFEIPWNPRLVKEILWRETQRVVLGKDSTTELEKQKDIDLVYDVLNRFLAKHGIHVPFPSVER